MSQGVLHVHREHIRDGSALVVNLKRRLAEPAAFAHRTGHPHVRQKVHLDPVGPVPFTRLAASSAAARRHVEAEPPGLVAAQFGVRQLREQGPDFIEHFDIRGRIAPRRAADRRLVDGDHFVEVLETVDPRVRARLGGAGPIQIAGQRLV